jgi:transposase-like protein
MLNMPRKKGSQLPREGTGAAVRAEAARGGAATPPPKATRRTFSAEYKLRMVQEADEIQRSGAEGGIGEFLRREGLYSSHLTEWRRAAAAGTLVVGAERKPGPKPTRSPLAERVARLERENARLEEKLRKAEIVIDVQKKVAALLGTTLATPGDDDEPTS